MIIDEASQISVLEVLHFLGEFKDLQKLCVFGDPKQLPPDNLEAAPGLKTIYDFEQLRKETFLLDTQYRMPIPLGNFISKHVHGGELKSEHRNKSDVSCVSFIDAGEGCETRSGHSWINSEEIDCVISLVRNYFNGLRFCVITPYDAQRNALEAALKREGLPWDTVFNVDSFQGNETDHILLSVVRTRNPGFLTFTKRMNVMLTRCKSSITIVANREFISGEAKKTLIGKLRSHWFERYEKTAIWNSRQALLNRTARLSVVPLAL